MNARTPTLPPAVAQAREQARTWWKARVPRERAALGLAGGVVALFLVWLVFVQPAWRTLREAPPRLDALEAQLQQMQRLAAESQGLRGVAAVPQAQAAAALKAATDRLGDKGRLSLQGERASLTLKLNSQKIDTVNFRQDAIQIIRDFNTKLHNIRRDQSGRAAHDDARSQFDQPMDIGPSDSAVANVAHQRDSQARNSAQLLPDGEDIE